MAQWTDKMTRQKDSERNPSLPVEMALAALHLQLAKLESFMQCDVRNVESAEAEWVHLTKSIIANAFFHPSSKLHELREALWAGQQNVTDVGPLERQVNFQLRVEKCDALLRSFICGLELRLSAEGSFSN
jgi:hypothetical protein